MLIPNYLLYKDAKDGAAYSVPQGTEIEIYRKVCPAILTLGTGFSDGRNAGQASNCEP